MPCKCFGKKKTPKILSSDVPYGKGYIKAVDEGDFVSSKNKNHTYLAPEEYQKRDSYRNDSSGSKSNTPSTAPAVASTPNSSLSASPSASPTSYRGALRRCELAEKRKEFFRDYFIVDEKKCQGGGNSATLPASIRTRSFGEYRHVRPTSQPDSLSGLHIQHPPPGPHLLHPVSPQEKIKTETFASPVFLNELRNASEEISRRWQMSDEERDSIPCSLKGKVKVFPVTYVERNYSIEDDVRSDFPQVNINESHDIKFNPELNLSTEQQYINNCMESPEKKVSVESPEIDISTKSPLIHICTDFPDIINISKQSLEIDVDKEYNPITHSPNVFFDDQIAAVGSGTSSDIALNFPSIGDENPTSPTIDAAPRIVQPNKNDAQIFDHKNVLFSMNCEINASNDFNADIFADRSNIPLQQELGRISEGNENADEEVNMSFSSEEIAEEIPKQVWQEDEIKPLLEDDEIKPLLEDDETTLPTIRRDTSPNVTNIN